MNGAQQRIAETDTDTPHTPTQHYTRNTRLSTDLSGGDSGGANLLAELGVDERCGRLLDDLLVAALHTAVALEEVHTVACVEQREWSETLAGVSVPVGCCDSGGACACVASRARVFHVRFLCV